MTSGEDLVEGTLEIPSQDEVAHGESLEFQAEGFCGGSALSEKCLSEIRFLLKKVFERLRRGQISESELNLRIESLKAICGRLMIEPGFFDAVDSYGGELHRGFVMGEHFLALNEEFGPARIKAKHFISSAPEDRATWFERFLETPKPKEEPGFVLPEAFLFAELGELPPKDVEHEVGGEGREEGDDDYVREMREE